MPKKPPADDPIVVVLVLGAPNDSRGRLSGIAISRVRTALAKHRSIPGSKLLLTGGHGQHFNTAAKPHAYYAARYLRRSGVPASDILGMLPSANTIEDAVMAREFLQTRKVRRVYVVTSDYHARRARFIFKRLLEEWRIAFIEATTNVPAAELQRLREHERLALQRLRKEGLGPPIRTP